MTAPPGVPEGDASAILDHAACGLMQTTDDGTFRRVNAPFCAWTGYAREELVGRRRLQDLLTMGGKIFHQTHWSPLLRIQGSLSEVKLEVVHRDGSVVPMVLNAIRRADAGVFVHEVAAYVARDRDRYEQELVHSRKRLEVLVGEAKQLHAVANDRALFAEQMIGIVSHDLRNPLQTIDMAAEMLAGLGSHEEQRYVAQIHRAVDRAHRLLVDLLDFTQARVGAGLSVAISRGDLHEAVAEIVEAQRVAYPQRAITHVREGHGPGRFDANRLAQAIGNLVVNAVTYGRDGSPIRVTSIVGPTELSVSVHNDGTPIPETSLATIFQPMTRGTKAASKSRSVGLGLFIVQEIARAHGGGASVRSSAAEGTTFTLAFPRA